MFGIKSIISTAFLLFLLFSFKSYADTFVVINLNDPGVGSLRQAIADVDCIFTNVSTGGGNGRCSIAPAGADDSIPLFLLIPALIVMRRFYKKCRG